jgi:hypothetical protein
MTYTITLTEEQVSVIMQALNYWCNYNQYLSDEQMDAVNGAWNSIVDAIE